LGQTPSVSLIMVASSQFVMSPLAEEFQPAGLQDSICLPGPPPGLAITTQGESNAWLDNSKKTGYPPGLAPISGLAKAIDAPPGLACPPGLDLINEDTAPDVFGTDGEDSNSLTEEKLWMSNKILEMESARLAQQNEILRTKLASRGQGPPGVWQPSAWMPTDTWCAWTQGAYNPWTESQGHNDRGVLGRLGAVTKQDDECSEVSEASTVDLSGSEDTEDSINSLTASPEIDAVDSCSEDGV